MTIVLQSHDEAEEERRRRRRRYLAILPLLLSLFLAALGVFTLLMRGGMAPRAGLPSVLGTQSGKPSFDRAVEPVGRPLAVAISPDGKKLYVAESAGAYGVQVFDKAGAAVASLNPPHTTETTRQPMGLAVAQDGTGYVVDRRLQQVVVYEADGTYRDVLKPDGVDSWAPLGITVDQQGVLYVTEALDLPETQRHRVYVLNADGSIVKEFGQKGDASNDLMFPGPIAVDNHGRIWVGDITGVKVFGADGQFLFRLRSEGEGAVALPGGIAAHGDHVYVSDTINHQVLVFKSSPDVATFEVAFGQLGFGRGDFRYPSGIAVSASRIYIADRENGRVDIWTP